MDTVWTAESTYEDARQKTKEFVRKSGFKNQRVLVKPNLLCPTPPEEVATTHPEIVRGAVEALIDRGCEVYLGDSSAGQDSLDPLLKETGILNALKGLKIRFVDLDKLPAIKLKFRGFTQEEGIPISKIITDVDAILNLPKYKTHILTGFTGAAKNFFGLVPRHSKKEFHAKFTNPAMFSTMMVDLAASVTKKLPTFHIMDAIWGMEGSGPRGGTKKEIGMMVAGKNPFQVDNFAIGMVKPRFNVFMDEIAQKLKLVPEYTVEGPTKEFELKKPKTYKAMRWLNLIPNLGVLASFIRYPNVYDDCIGCGTCVKNCPVTAISMTNKKARIDRKKCIKCFTCAEVCPVNAIK